MNTEEITRTIAEFMGDIVIRSNSLDALQPVLAKFTEEMQYKLSVKLDNEYLEPITAETPQLNGPNFWILTLPASTLARLVAETIKESKK